MSELHDLDAVAVEFGIDLDDTVCHCGRRVSYGFDGDPEHHRGMCAECDVTRCDAYLLECPYAWGCHDCGLPYGKPGWVDTWIPSETWDRISPTGDGAGFLCISCMASRLVAAGIDNVPLTIGSGPWGPVTGNAPDA